MNFFPPSYRAAASDLTVAVSPLGLVELADEEFEVHGPRLSRYASNWAWYLGHHWASKREIGEPQLTFNYSRALVDYGVNFAFNKPPHFGSPEATEVITPHILKRVWEVDNDKDSLIWDLGLMGAVSGDVFVKVAYEPPVENPLTGEVSPGRVRILPINPAFAFPEWHPHDKDRVIKFKMKYKFWGVGADGTRMIHTYTELMTDTSIEEYINDEMIDQRPNPLGRIPVVYVQNFPVVSSPWGLSDIQDLIPLNREYNEKATEVSDIVNYHSAPITVVLGAKAGNLERGPKKIWAIPNKDASIQNLQLEGNLSGPIGYLELIKTAMHEMAGVPVTALGQMQPVSNTSGVALHMTYLPLMQKYEHKKTQYTKLFKRINDLVIRHIAIYEPEMMMFSPFVSAVKPGPTQYLQLDPNDPVTYESTVEWPSPLPLDVLLTLNEVQAEMSLGMESKRGALKKMGTAFPDQKIQEVFEETVEDTKRQGALNLINAQVAQFTIQATGMTPDGQPLILPGVTQTDEEGNPVGMAPTVDPYLAQEILMLAYEYQPAARTEFDEDG